VVSHAVIYGQQAWTGMGVILSRITVKVAARVMRSERPNPMSRIGWSAAGALVMAKVIVSVGCLETFNRKENSMNQDVLAKLLLVDGDWSGDGEPKV